MYTLEAKWWLGDGIMARKSPFFEDIQLTTIKRSGFSLSFSAR
jgi:hypothetical protein